MALAYLAILAFLPLVYSTIRSTRSANWRDAVFVRNLLKDYLRTIPALAMASLPIVLFPAAANWIVFGLHALFMPLVVLEIGHVHVFGARIGLNTFYSLFVTNMRETKEFIRQNVSSAQIILAAGLYLAPMMFLPFLPNWHWSDQQTVVWAVAIDIVLIMPFVRNAIRRVEKQKRGYILNPFTSVFFHYIQFRRKYGALRKAIESHAMPPFNDIVSSLPSDMHQTYVIVVGESSNAHHHSYCGYPRKTNEFTEGLGDRMLRFTNVHSQFAQTLPSLENTITFADTSHPELLATRGSIVDYFHDAGFKTWWLSNQYALEDTAITAMTAHADVTKCFNYGDYKRADASGYDGDMLPDFEKALAAPAPQKVIFLHLIGSHAAYVNRYPAAFRHFTGPVSNRDNLLPSANQLVNTYDDSIRYTDWFLAEIVKRLQAVNDVSYMLYFADHGEDVFDTTTDKPLGHSQLANEPMTSVPMILWMSPAFDKVRPDVRLRANVSVLSSTFKLEDAIHFIADLSSLANPDVQRGKSYLNAYTSQDH